MKSWYRKLSVLLVVVTVLTVGAGVASAQEPPRGGQWVGARALVAALADLTGLSARELLADLSPGATLADVAAAHDVDPAAVVEQAAATITEQVNRAVENGRLSQERADEILATLESDLTNLMNQPLPEVTPPRPGIVDRVREGGVQSLIGAAAELTGLEPAEILQQMRQENLTLAQVVEANGVDPQEVVEAAVADATGRINQAVENGRLSQEQADRLLAGLETAFTNAMTHPLPPRPEAGRPRPVMEAIQIVLQTVSELTGLEQQEIMEQVRQGSSLAAILEANGVDVETAVDSIMAQATERINQQMEEQLNNLEQRVRDALNRVPPLPPTPAN